MRFLATLLLVGSLSLPLGGCFATLGSFGSKVYQDVTNITGVISGATVTPQAVVIAANSADALEDTASAYLRLPRCRANGSPICRVPAATQPLKRAVLTMRVARNEIEVYVVAGTPPPASLYDKVAAAASALSNIIAQYNISPVIATIAK